MTKPALSRSLLFVSFLALGAVSGFFLGSFGKAMAAPIRKGEMAQHNVLVVLVDDLGTQPSVLKGIWLAAQSAGSAQINWMPIYPVPILEGTSEYAQPHSQIFLASKDLQDLTFLPPIRNQGIWWDETSLLDETALSAMATLAGNQPTALADTWLEPQRALQEQVQLIQNLCKSATSWSSSSALDQSLALMPDHMRSSLSSFEMIAHWDSWSLAGFALSCTHPWAN